jgi:hypothetical protein
MTRTEFASIAINPGDLTDTTLTKGLFICLLHVKRVPPHIGILIDGKYHSLTIKGIEPNVSISALLRTIQQQKIESVFLKISPHPVFSNDHMNSIFLELLKKYPQIRSNEVTCLSPLKDFFNEFYAINTIKNDMIFDLLKRMAANNFILQAYSLNLSLENNTLSIPVYSQEELNEKINAIRKNY